MTKDVKKSRTRHAASSALRHQIYDLLAFRVCDGNLNLRTSDLAEVWKRYFLIIARTSLSDSIASRLCRVSWFAEEVGFLLKRVYF